MDEFLKETRKETIKFLYESGSVLFDANSQFELKGEIESPIFCRAKDLCCGVEIRSHVGHGLLMTFHHDRAQRNFDVDAIAGVASGGVSWATSVANCDMLDLLTVHPHLKKYGVPDQIEGYLRKDKEKVVVIDDVLTTGKHLLNAVKALRKGQNGKHAEVLGVYTIFDWCFPSVDKEFEKQGIVKKHLFSFKELLDYGFEHHFLPEEARAVIARFEQKHC